MKISVPSAFALSAICTVTALMGADQPGFETASVKRTDRCGMQNSIDPGMITLNGDPLKVVLAEAFHVKMDQIVGPSWLDADCFALVAKMPEGATRDQVPAMFQALLVERFHLAAHKESRPSPGYALMVDKNGPKFKEADPSSTLAGRWCPNLLAAFGCAILPSFRQGDSPLQRTAHRECLVCREE